LDDGGAAGGFVVVVLVPVFAVVVVDRRLEAASRWGPDPEVGVLSIVTRANTPIATATATAPMRMSVRGERRRPDASPNADSSTTEPVSRVWPRL
jgi:hypothetical protein